MDQCNCAHCTDRHGNPKRLYPTWEDAERAAGYILSTRGVELRIYECDHSWGFHLTSDLGGGW